MVKTIATDGPGFFLRSHDNSPYFWADVFFGPHKDEMHVIDKKTLEIVKTLRPAPGKTVAHVEFTRDGAYALVSVWEDDGAVIVYDAKTLGRGETAADAETLGEIQCLEQDHLRGWHLPLRGAGRSGSSGCCFIRLSRRRWRSTFSCSASWDRRWAFRRSRPCSPLPCRSRSACRQAGSPRAGSGT